MVSGSCFVFLIVVFSLQSFTILCSMQAKGSFKVADGELLYANFFYFPGHKLWGTKPIESRTVSEDETCVAACIETSQCRSVNLKRVSSADGKSICHLLDTDKFRSSAGSFNESAQFDHYSLAVSNTSKLRFLFFFLPALSATFCQTLDVCNVTIS